MAHKNTNHLFKLQANKSGLKFLLALRSGGSGNKLVWGAFWSLLAYTYYSGPDIK